MSRLGRVTLEKNESMNAIDLREAFPNIMDMFDSGFSEVISVMEDGIGEYRSFISIAGINVVYIQDQYGFETLMTVDNYDLSRMLGTNAESIGWE